MRKRRSSDLRAENRAPRPRRIGVVEKEAERSGSDSSTSIGFGVVGVSTAFFGVPATFIAVLDSPTSQKVVWILAIAVLALLLGFALYKRLTVRLVSGNLRKGGWTVFLAISALLNVGALALMAFDVQRAIRGVPLTCVAPGEGPQEYARAFQQAYDRNGGKAKLGCPVSNVRPFDGGFHQNLQGELGPAVIMAVSPEKAFVLDPDEWTGYHKIQGPGKTTSSVGFPYDEGVAIANGKMLELGAGSGAWPRTAIVKRNDGEWHWIQSGLWEGYRDRFGGPEGRFGYPIAEEEYKSGLRSQRFEGGVLYFLPEYGTLTEEELSSAPRDAPLTARISGPLDDVYKVGSQGGVSHSMPKNAHVDQPFRATVPTIEKLGVIVGLDPKNDTGGVHRLELQLLNDGRVIASNSATLVNNEYTTVSISGASVEVGRAYVLRVWNRSDHDDVLGFYTNDPARPGQVADPGARCRLVGEQPRPEPYVHRERALSGLVQGRKSH